MDAERPTGPVERPVSPTSDRAAALAARMAVALSEYEASFCDPDSAARAQQILTEWDELRGGVGDHDQRRRELWAWVAEARAALRHSRTPDPSAGRPAIPQSTIDRVERLHTELLDAEERAHRKLASPKSYRRLIAARTDLTDVLGDLGFESYDDFLAATTSATGDPGGGGPGRGGPGRGGPGGDTAEDGAALAEALAEAESAWAAFESAEPGALPPGPQADALRARAYRLLGVVLDDDELKADLEAVVGLQSRHSAARTLLEGALRDAGFDPGDDPAALARMWLRAN